MNASPSLYLATGPGVPGTTGTPTFMATNIQSIFNPRNVNIHFRFTKGSRLRFITEPIDNFRRGADESKSSLLDFLRKTGIFGQEPVSEEGSFSEMMKPLRYVIYPG
jgi:hypothetical protein